MGCDIHIRVEYKKKGEDFWRTGEHYQKDTFYGGYEIVPVYSGRNYELFGLLAGVRGGMRPISLPRGIPDDATDDTKTDYLSWGNDAHSASWYDYEKLREYYEEKADMDAEDAMEDLMRLLEERLYSIPVWTSNGDKMRIIFWFDN